VLYIFASVNRPQGAKNGIRVVIITPGTASQPAQQLGSASVNVENAVAVNDFNYLWAGGCPGDPAGAVINPISLVLRANQPPIQVGAVQCGFTDNTSPVTCGDSVNLTIDTSLGAVAPATQTWNVNVPACQTGGP
jgi:hypothetical protein